MTRSSGSPNDPGAIDSKTPPTSPGRRAKSALKSGSVLNVGALHQKPRLSMQIQLGDGVNTLPVGRQQLRRWAHAALQQDVALTLRFVSEPEGRALNLEFRDQDHATNVLTFQYPGDPVHENANNVQDSHEFKNDNTNVIRSPAQADVLICLPVIQVEAAEQNKPVHHHLAHLVIHGTLHAQGWDHQNDIEAQAMEAMETQLLARFGIPDPYRNLGANS